MDAYTAVGTTSGIISLVGMVGYGVYKLLVHSHCRSACCGRDFVDVAFNLDEKEGDRSVYVPMPNPAVVCKNWGLFKDFLSYV